MAVVATYHYPHGTVQVLDDAYRDASPEELKFRFERMCRISDEILVNAERRKREQEQNG